jgi:cation/acetate symporter
MGTQVIPVIFVTGIVLATIGLGMYGTRLSRTTSDFYVAGRGVGAFWNSSAITGEYLSAASFMGIAGMLMKYGYDVLWYAVGYSAGFLVLLLFIAAPLRRFGAYTIPDFAHGRLDSIGMRKVAVAFVLAIGFFYMMPQLKGAGITLAQLFGSPYWVGVVLVGGVVAVNVVIGGMKGLTLVQAFQHWVKQFAIMVPLFVIVSVTGTGVGATLTAAERVGGTDPVPAVSQDLTAHWPAGGAVAFTSDGTIVPRTDTRATLTRAPGATSPSPASRRVTLSAGTPFRAAKGERLVFAESVSATIRAGTTMPNVIDGRSWSRPFGAMTARFGDRYALLYTVSLLVALLCGTAGLPHILVRFYTNPDGRRARLSTLMVVVFTSLFYVFPAAWGALGRTFVPSLYANGSTDLAILKLPEQVMAAAGSPLAGAVLVGVMSAGAFAAFMTTFSGLLMSVASTFAHDIYARIMHPKARASARLTAFQIAAAGCAAIAICLALLIEEFDINLLVGWVFAIAASTFFPLLLMGVWHRGLTPAGAVTGMLAGGAGSIGSVIYSMLVELGVAAAPAPLIGVLTHQPAIWTVPLAIGLMFAVSRATRSSVPANARLIMLRLHAPEQLGLRPE